MSVIQCKLLEISLHIVHFSYLLYAHGVCLEEEIRKLKVFFSHIPWASIPTKQENFFVHLQEANSVSIHPQVR